MAPYRMESAFDNFQVLDLSRPNGPERLLSLLVAEPRHALSLAGPAIYDRVMRSGICQSVVVERNYTDRDHSHSYQKFYARGFQQYDRYTIRLHFFSSRISRDALRNLERPRYRDSYLGFCVVRPLKARKVGRTVLDTRLAEGGADYHLGLSTYDVNLAGSRLQIRGAPFLEQDVHVGACATAAIWMSTTVASKLLGISAWTTAQITEGAFNYPLGDQILAGRGLRLEEMERALWAMGYKPQTLGVSTKNAALDAIHPYVEGGFSPIALLELLDGGHHAVVIVGHGYDATKPAGPKVMIPLGQEKIEYHRSSDWLNHLIVHDDQVGPYRTMRFLTEAEVASLSQEPGCYVEIDQGMPSFPTLSLPPKRARLYGIVVPVPQGVTLIGEEAVVKSARILKMYFDGLQSPMPEDYVLRTYLTNSNDFKVFVGQRTLPRFVKDAYRSKPLPRWIWVTELCTPADVLASTRTSRATQGELLLDGNGSDSTPDFLGLHLVGPTDGYLALMTSDDHSPADALNGGKLYPSAEPYEALVR